MGGNNRVIMGNGNRVGIRVRTQDGNIQGIWGGMPIRGEEGGNKVKQKQGGIRAEWTVGNMLQIMEGGNKLATMAMLSNNL